jgi:DNA-directed RNA polymerase subunit RPC12/RpoP
MYTPLLTQIVVQDKQNVDITPYCQHRFVVQDKWNVGIHPTCSHRLLYKTRRMIHYTLLLIQICCTRQMEC